MSSIEFVLTEWLESPSHGGKHPRGYGCWAFAFGGPDEDPVFYPASTYGDAKKAAKRDAHERGVTEVWVLP